jgi:invasion protein IalB
MRVSLAWPAACRRWAIPLARALAMLAATPAAATTRTEKSFGNWDVVCVQEDDNAPKRCTLLQSRVTADNNRLVLVWSISSGEKKGLTQAVTVPAGVSVKEGVRLFIGDAEPLTMPYDICGVRVCVATAPLDDKLVEIIKAAQKASANYVQMSKQLLQVNLELNGFAEAYDYFIKQLS